MPYIKSAVLFVLPAIAPEGISKVALMQLQYLLEEDYNVKLLVLSNVDKNVLQAFAPSLRSDQLIQLRKQDAYLSVKALTEVIGTVAKLKKVLSNFKPDIIFAHAPYAQFLLRLARLWPGVPQTKLWAYFHFPQYQEFPLNTFRRKTINSLNRWLAQHYDSGHISVSKTVKEDIIHNLVELENHIVIYNAFESTKPIVTPKIMDAAFTIVVPGRIESIKGQCWFLEVFYNFIQCYPDNSFKLIFAGGGSQEFSLKLQAKRLNLAEVVQITGNITYQDILAYLAGANLVVVPSQMEGFGMVVLEALQFDKIVLSSDAGGLKEVIEDGKTGILFKCGNKADCLTKLHEIYAGNKYMLVDQETRKARLQEKFSFKKQMQQLISIIDNVK